MLFSIKSTRVITSLVSYSARKYDVELATCKRKLRFIRHGVRLGDVAAGELVDDDENGTRQSPVVIEVVAWCDEGSGSPGGHGRREVRDAVLQILQPLATDPFLPEHRVARLSSFLFSLPTILVPPSPSPSPDSPSHHSICPSNAKSTALPLEYTPSSLSTPS
ncbi:hypothetical protein JCM3765_006911 [Sporobolomyces pararoseus]